MSRPTPPGVSQEIQMLARQGHPAVVKFVEGERISAQQAALKAQESQTAFTNELRSRLDAATARSTIARANFEDGIRKEALAAREKRAKDDATAKAKMSADSGNANFINSGVETALKGMETETIRPGDPMSTQRTDAAGGQASTALAESMGRAGGPQPGSPGQQGGSTGQPGGTVNGGGQQFDVPGQITERSVGFGAPGRVDTGSVNFGVPNPQIRETSRDNVITAGEAARLSEQRQNNRSDLFLKSLDITKNPTTAYALAVALQDGNPVAIAEATQGSARMMQQAYFLETEQAKANVLNTFSRTRKNDAQTRLALAQTTNEELNMATGGVPINAATILHLETAEQWQPENNMGSLDKLADNTRLLFTGNGEERASMEMIAPALATGWLAYDMALFRRPKSDNILENVPWIGGRPDDDPFGPNDAEWATIPIGKMLKKFDNRASNPNALLALGGFKFDPKTKQWFADLNDTVGGTTAQAIMDLWAMTVAGGQTQKDITGGARRLELYEMIQVLEGDAVEQARARSKMQGAQ